MGESYLDNKQGKESYSMEKDDIIVKMKQASMWRVRVIVLITSFGGQVVSGWSC